MILWKQLEKIAFFEAGFSVEEKGEGCCADERGKALEEDGPAECDQYEAGVERMANGGVDAVLDQFRTGTRSGVRRSVGAESTHAGDADECTEQNQECTDRDSGRIENGGVEKGSENERSHGQEILGVDPPAIFGSGCRGFVLFVLHRLIVTDRGMECE